MNHMQGWRGASISMSEEGVDREMVEKSTGKAQREAKGGLTLKRESEIRGSAPREIK